MRSYKSFNDLRSLARTYLSFADKDGTERSRSFSGTPYTSSLACVNFRDCGLVSSNLKEGLVYRSSQVVSSAEIQNLQLNAILDLRVMKKPCKRREDELLWQVKQEEARTQSMRNRPRPEVDITDEDAVLSMPDNTVQHELTNARVCPFCTEEFGHRHGVDVPIYHSDLVPWQTKLRVFGKLPVRMQARALKELCQLRNPVKLVAAAVVDPDVMGPTVLYKVLLDHSKISMAKALRIFARQENYPVLVHCIHGKDRTGLIVMLLLLLCDVPAQLVVEDYIKSEMQLKAGRDKGELHELDDFLTSDNVIASKAETMLETIAHIEVTYGSARGYAHAVGLSPDEIAGIRTNFMKQADAADLFDRMESRPSRMFSFDFCEAAQPGGQVREDAALIAAADRFLEQAPVSTSSGSSGSISGIPEPITELPEEGCVSPTMSEGLRGSEAAAGLQQSCWSAADAENLRRRQLNEVEGLQVGAGNATY